MGRKVEQKYIISGTPEELQLILKKEFSLSDEKARVAAAVFVYEQNQEQNQEQLEEDALWFLNGSQPQYQSRIFSTRYTISFTKTMLDVIDELLVPGVLALCGIGEFAVLSEILYCIKALVKNTRRIKDNECCVYFNILQNLKMNSGQWFTLEQAMPNIGETLECVNLDKNWKCPFKLHENNEKCQIQLSDVKNILSTFCNDGIMKCNDNGTLYKFKI